MPEVGVAVLTYNPGPELTTTLTRVVDSDVSPDNIVVVDNASPDRPPVEARGHHLGVRIGVMEANLGYGGAMNRAAGLLRARGMDRLLFLTQEAWLAPDALRRMLAHLEDDPQVGLIGPLLGRVSAPDEIWSAGGTLTKLTGKPVHRWGGRPVSASPAALADVTWLDGAALLMRSEAFEAAGGFREDLFLYWEDVAISLGVRRAGWRVCCATDAVALQEPSMTPPYLMARNRALVLGPRGYVGAAVDALLWAARDVLRGRGLRRTTLAAAGLRDAMRHGRLDRSLALERP